MAEQANKATTVMDKIRSHFTKEGKCEVDISKFQAAVSIIPCSNDAKCWSNIACQQEINIPEMDREMIEVDSGVACNLFSNSGESWKEFIPDSTRMMGEFTMDAYYNPDRFDELMEAAGSLTPYIVVIEVNDKRRTQFAFRAYLKTLSANFVSNSDSSVSMIPITWQPTGAPFTTEGAELNYC